MNENEYENLETRLRGFQLEKPDAGLRQRVFNTSGPEQAKRDSSGWKKYAALAAGLIVMFTYVNGEIDRARFAKTETPRMPRFTAPETGSPMVDEMIHERLMLAEKIGVFRRTRIRPGITMKGFRDVESY